MAFMTFYYAKLANINVGIIATIWAINPLYMAILDYIVNAQKLTSKHLIGMVCLISCTLLISFSSVIIPKGTSSGLGSE